MSFGRVTSILDIKDCETFKEALVGNLHPWRLFRMFWMTEWFSLSNKELNPSHISKSLCIRFSSLYYLMKGDYMSVM